MALKKKNYEILCLQVPIHCSINVQASCTFYFHGERFDFITNQSLGILMVLSFWNLTWRFHKK